MWCYVIIALVPVYTAVAQRYKGTELQYHFKCNDLERSAPLKYVRFANIMYLNT